MKYLISLILLALASQLSSAQTVKEVVEFERAKLNGYYQAKDQDVIVWVNCEDLHTFLETKNKGYHCFVSEFPGVKQGIVIGRWKNGVLERYKDTTIEGLRDEYKASKIPTLNQLVPTQYRQLPVGWQYIESGSCTTQG
jgi:hypothetical protein